MIRNDAAGREWRLAVLVVGAVYPDSFSWSIASAMRRAGCDVRRFSDEGPRFLRGSVRMQKLMMHARRIQIVEKTMNSRLVRLVVRTKPDMVLISYNTFSPATIRAIRGETGAIVANWFPDPVSNFERQYIIGSDYDLLFFKDRYIVRFFREKLGMEDCYYLPQCCDRELHRTAELTPADRQMYGCDLTTAASLYYYRARMLEPFLDGYDLKIWGNVPRWLDSRTREKAMDRELYGLEKARAFRAAKIVLNTQHFAEIEGVNKRTFEAAGCGAFQITDEKPALPDLFEPGREIVTFSTRADLKEKVDYYLARPREREEIAQRAAQRAHAEHTYDHRVAVILSHARRLLGARKTTSAGPPVGVGG